MALAYGVLPLLLHYTTVAMAVTIDNGVFLCYGSALALFVTVLCRRCRQGVCVYSIGVYYDVMTSELYC